MIKGRYTHTKPQSSGSAHNISESALGGPGISSRIIPLLWKAKSVADEAVEKEKSWVVVSAWD